MELTGKKILVVSPQNWGNMFLSKHHYAIEFAKRGNKVYFLNPPDQEGKLKANSLVIERSPVHDNLYLISHRTFFPYVLKFRALPLFHFLMRWHVQKIERALGGDMDILWSFDIGNLYPLGLFKTARLKVFHPVDEPLRPEAIEAANGADLILSVTNEILEKYERFDKPKFLVQHGVKQDFVELFSRQQYHPGSPLQVGYAGSMLRGDIDRQTLLTIVKNHPDLQFNFFGGFLAKDTNVGGIETKETNEFIQELKGYLNVKLHGALDQDSLARAFTTIDIFLVCYDIKKDPSRGTNYHKLMEYLATGRVIVANNITAYAGRPDLIQMVESRENNQELPGLFRKIVSNLPEHNSFELMEARKKFAAGNTYSKQTQRIADILTPY